MMSEELKKKLLAKHAEEVKDNENYYILVKEMSEAGYGHAAGILADIADEEEKHAEMIKLILDKGGEV